MAFNPLNPFYALGETFLRIFRNKRRSMAMLSGVMLGTLIFSSIFLYTGVLKQETYESVIKQISYEASFTLNEPGTEDDVWALASRINNEKRVESSTVFVGGDPGGGTDPFGDTDMLSMGPIVSARIEGDVAREQPSGNEAWPAIATIKPVFVGDDFTSTTIYDKLIGDRLEGTFDLSRPGNWAVIPRTTAIRMNLVVGDVLPAISVTCFSLDGEGGTAAEKFESVTIAAVYESIDSLDPLAVELGLETIYLSSRMLDSGGELRKAFEDKGLITLAVRIEKEEFNTGDLAAMNKEVNQFVNDIARDSGDVLSGTNNAGMILGMFQIQNILLILIDMVLIIPIAILTIYLLIYGLELSLEERKKEIGILKIQGANSKQIFKMVMNESVLILAIGMVFGYGLAIIGAWVISSSVGFMSFVFSMGYLKEFITFDLAAFLISFLIIGLIVFLSILKRGRRFINLQVSEAVQQMDWKKQSFMRRNRIDLILFGFGFISAVKVILDQAFDITSLFGVEMTLGTGWDAFLFGFLGTVALWIGGAFSAPVLAQWIANKLEKVMLKLAVFRDIGPIIKSGLKRRGDVVKLVFIIALTLSVAALAATQGYTDERFTIRELEFQIGADYRVEFSGVSDHSPELTALKGVDDAMPLPTLAIEILSTPTVINGVDAADAQFARWHANSFKNTSPMVALDNLAQGGSIPGVYVGSEVAALISSRKGDVITIKVSRTDSRTGESATHRLDVVVLGEFDHAPGGIGENSLIADLSTIIRLRELTYGEGEGNSNASTYLVGALSGADAAKLNTDLIRLAGVTKVFDLEHEIDDIGNQVNYGMPGLLTMMFITALIASLTIAFTFSSIIMKRRLREFAVLQTLGASRGQVYKTAVSESAVLMLVSVIWGILVGLALSFMMNGFFEIIGDFLGRGTLKRVVFIPWAQLGLIALATFLGMLLAVAMSAISAARQDLSIATRVI
jgi:ABC-type lipoprotein release transport system permease subunit